MVFLLPAFARAMLATSTLAAAFAAASDASAAGPPDVRSAEEAAFLADNDKAMSTMMDGMSIKPTGDVDRDFAAAMIPHHQGAIDMAQAELRYGHNESLRRIAQEIVVEQQQEIAAMRLALGQPLPPSMPAPDQARAMSRFPTASNPCAPSSDDRSFTRESQ